MGKTHIRRPKNFYFLFLETFPLGLSWITILKKEKILRKSFDNFDYIKISKYNKEKIKKLENCIIKDYQKHF